MNIVRSNTRHTIHDQHHPLASSREVGMTVGEIAEIGQTKHCINNFPTDIVFNKYRKI